MFVIGRAKALIAELDKENRGEVRKLEELAASLKDIAPKVEAEFKSLEEALGKPSVTIAEDGLPVPDSLYADYLRVRGELDRLLGKPADVDKSQETPDEASPVDESAA